MKDLQLDDNNNHKTIVNGSDGGVLATVNGTSIVKVTTNGYAKKPALSCNCEKGEIDCV